MATTEEILAKMALLMKDQNDMMTAEREESVKREQRMQALLESALTKLPVQDETQKAKIPSNATPAPMLSNNATLREFATWKQKFEDYSLLTGIHKAPNDQQKAILRSLLDDEWFRVAKFALNIQMESDETTVDTIIEQMQIHLRSQRNIVLDRKEFYLRNQQQEERFDDYFIALQEIAGFCDFCNHCLDEQFRDRIVTGIQNDETVKDLLSEKKLTLDKAVAICRANENASKDTENLQGTASGISRLSGYNNRRASKQYQTSNDSQYRGEPYKKYQSSHQYKDQSGDKKKFQRRQCQYCGGEWHEYLSQCPVWKEREKQKPAYNQYRNNNYNQTWENKKFQRRQCRKCGGEWHESLSQCPANDKNCSQCGIKGHYARYCVKEVADEEYDSGNSFRITVNEVSYRKKTPKVPVTVTHNQKAVSLEGTPDTGAEKSVIGVKEATKLGANIDNLKHSKIRLYAADRKRLTNLGVLPVQLTVGNKTAEVELVVVSEVKGFLLSWYHLIDLGILPQCFPLQVSRVSEEFIEQQDDSPPVCSDKQPSKLMREAHKKKLLSDFQSVFDVSKELKTMKGKPMRILLTDDAVPFALTAARTIPFAWKDRIKNQLSEMVEKGIIKEVKEPTEWCHPIVPVAKKGTSEVRICVDLTKLNKYVRRGAHPVLTAHDAVSGVTKDSKFFTTMDAKAGYWQIPIADEDQELTTFITPWGRFKFLRAPMGLSISGDEYNRRGDEALQSSESTAKIVDDILTYELDYQSHLNNVWKILNKCREYGITLNPEKFNFACDEVEYCGYHLNSEGFTPNRKKIHAIEEFKAPGNVTELKSFLGMVNQLSQFSADISALAEPLRHLLKKGYEWKWNDNHEKSFTAVKEALSKPPVLAYYDPKLPVMLQTDAARLKGLGYVCLQKHERAWKLIDCGSRFLTDTESRYATIEMEMLAITWAVKKCKRFLAGREHFDIITDHKPLIPIVNTKGLYDIENPRLQRMRESLLPYSFVLGWKKGADHAIPDALSRSPVDEATEEDEIAEQEIEDHIHQVVTSNIKAVFEDEGKGEFQDALLEELHKSSMVDPEYILLKKTILNGFPSNHNEVDPSLRPYAKMKDLLCVDNGMVVCGQRLVVPRKLRKEVLQRLHSSHQGIERTRRRARQSVYWPGIDSDVQNTVQSCKSCQQMLPSLPKEPMIVEDEPSRPFEAVSTDYFEHAGKQYLIYADRLSGWPMVKMFNRGATAVKLITTLRKFFAATGVPEILRSDGGPQFKAESLRKFLHHWGVRIHQSAPYYPQSNGHAESAVKAVKHLIIKCTRNGNLDTDEFAAALLELRNSPRLDGQSPAQVLFGHPVRSIIPIHRRSYEEEWQKDQSECLEKRDYAKKKAELRYNESARSLPEFRLGTRVNLQDHKTGRWKVTGRVVEIGRNRQYLIKKSDGRSVWRNRRFIRRYYPVVPSSTYKEPTQSPEEYHHPIPSQFSPNTDHPCSPQQPMVTSPDHSPQRLPLFQMPKIDQRNLSKEHFSLPESFFEKLPQSTSDTARTRKAPQFIQVDPRKKKY